MKKITLQFKKKDFLGRYTDTKSCAITTALKRAGLKGCKDAGVMIMNKHLDDISEEESYDKMTDIVLAMYKFIDNGTYMKKLTPTPPKDFQITILLDV